MEANQSDSIYISRRRYLNIIPSTFPPIRDDQANIYIEVRAQLSQFIAAQAHSIVIYRWLIDYIINLPYKNPNNFVVFKTNYSNGSKFTRTIVERMDLLGIKINHGDRFGYVVCKMPRVKRVCDRAYEIGYFRQSPSLKLDYQHYVKGLITLEYLLCELGPLHHSFRRISYQRNAQCKLLNLVDNPIEMIASMMLGGYDLNSLLKTFNEISNYVFVDELFSCY